MCLLPQNQTQKIPEHYNHSQQAHHGSKGGGITQFLKSGSALVVLLVRAHCELHWLSEAAHAF